jgi:hypothetical protein
MDIETQECSTHAGSHEAKRYGPAPFATGVDNGLNQTGWRNYMNVVECRKTTLEHGDNGG